MLQAHIKCNIVQKTIKKELILSTSTGDLRGKCDYTFTDLAIPEFLNKSDLNCKSKEGSLSCLDGLSCYDERTGWCNGSCQCKIVCLDEENCL